MKLTKMEEKDLSEMKAMPEEKSWLDQSDGAYTTKDYLIAGATPALLGILGGVPEAGFSEGAKALGTLSASREKQQKSSIELAKERLKELSKGSSKKMQLKELASGKLVNYDPSEGAVTPIRNEIAGEIAGPQAANREATTKRAELKYQRDLAKEQRTKQLALDKEGRAQLDKHRKEIETLAKPFQKDFSDLATVKSVLGKVDTNPVEGAVAIYKLARVAQGAGVLSENDIRPFGGSTALNARLEQIIETAKTGKLTEANKAYLAETYNTLLSAQSRRYEGEVGDAVNRRLMESLYEGGRKSITPQVSVPKRIELLKFDAKKLKGEDKQAFDWARMNKKDPRAKKILDRIEAQYGGK